MQFTPNMYDNDVIVIVTNIINQRYITKKYILIEPFVSKGDSLQMRNNSAVNVMPN